MKKTIVVIAVIAIISSLMSCSNNSGDRETVVKKDFRDMYTEKIYCDIASDGSWMKIDTNPNNFDDYADTNAFTMIQLVNYELGFPSWVWEDMCATRSLDGRQSETHGRYEVSWTYHPNTGMEVIYKIIN